MTIAQVNPSKAAEKQPAAKIIKPTKETTGSRVSPHGSPRSLEEEVLSLKARNQILTETLSSIRETAVKEEKRLYDLVWFARNRSRYPNHQSRYRIEKADEHKDEIEKLKTTESDYYHGMHAGLLAAARLFKEQADILHINEHNEVSDEFLQSFAQHKQKIEKSLQEFPHIEANDFPDNE